MNHSTEISGLRFREQLFQLFRANERLARSAAVFLCGTAVAMARITGETVPFGIAFAAAVPFGGLPAALLGTTLGYLLAAPSPLSWQFAAGAVGAALLRRGLAAIAKKPRRWHSVFSATAAAGAAVVLPGVYSNPLIYDVLLWITTLMMAGAGAMFLYTGTGAVWQAPSERGQALRERSCVTSLCITASLCLMGLCSVSISQLSLGRSAATLLLLLTAAGAGSRCSALCGVVCGLVVGFSTGEFTMAIACFAVGGLLAGLFAPLGRFGSVAALTVCYGFFAMLAQRSTAGFMEVLLAAGVFLVFPASVPRRVGMLLSPRREQHVARLLMGERLEDVSAALRDVATTTTEVSRRLSDAYAEDLSGVCDRVAQNNCRGCMYQLSCWQKNYSDTMDAFQHGIAALRERGELRAEDFGASLTRCISRGQLAESLREEYQAYAGREEERRHAGRMRAIVTDQFEGLAGALEGLSHSMQGILPCGASFTGHIEEALTGVQREIREVLCWRNGAGRLTVRVELPAAMEKWVDNARLTAAVTAAAGLPMSDPVRSREGASLWLTFSERPLYRLEQGICQLVAGDGKVSGDTLRLVRCADGVSAMVLSDGMGCGMSAALDSAMLASLIARLLEAGLPCDSALRLVNSAMLVKGGRESLATLDAAEIDCYTGKTRFCKAGAAPTYLRHGGRGVVIDTVSLPAGILDGVEAESRELTLGDQDLLVMVSDGVPTEEEWLPKMLEEWQEKDLSALCRRLAESARLRCREPREDDITVVALRLVKNA